MTEQEIADRAIKDFGLTVGALKHDDPSIVVEGTPQDWFNGTTPMPDPEADTKGVSVSALEIGEGVMTACYAISKVYEAPLPRVLGYVLRGQVHRAARQYAAQVGSLKGPRVGPRYHFYPTVKQGTLHNNSMEIDHAETKAAEGQSENEGSKEGEPETCEG